MFRIDFETQCAKKKMKKQQDKHITTSSLKLKVMRNILEKWKPNALLIINSVREFERTKPHVHAHKLTKQKQKKKSGI